MKTNRQLLEAIEDLRSHVLDRMDFRDMHIHDRRLKLVHDHLTCAAATLVAIERDFPRPFTLWTRAIINKSPTNHHEEIRKHPQALVHCDVGGNHTRRQASQG